MTSIATTALMGLFVLQSFGLPTANLASAQAEIIEAPTYPSYTVSMTGYNAVPGQTDDTPNITASGAWTHEEVVAARSVDLADALPFGTVIMVTPKADSKDPNCGISVVQEGIGLRVIADSMHPRKRQQIDILFDTETKVKAAGRYTNRAVALGVCKDVEIKVVGFVEIKNIPKTQKELRLAVGALPAADEQNLAIKK